MLVLVLAVFILRLRRPVDAATRALDDVADRTGPLLGNVNTTIENVNTALTQVHTSLDGVNLQLARLDTVTAHVANLSTVVSAAAANPLVKVAAFSYGVRKAAAKRRQAEETRELRDELSQRRKAAKRARREGGTR